MRYEQITATFKESNNNIIQRSNIDLGSRAQCPECGREVEANEKFHLECGAKL